MATRRWVWGVVVLLSGSARAFAQPATVSGRIFVAGDSTRGVADAEVTLRPGLRMVRSDSLGNFRFAGVNRGTYTVRVRRVGFEVSMRDVVVGGEQSPVPLDIPLLSGAQVLAEVVISGERVLYPARLSEPYTRVARGRGAFFTRELIDSLQPWDPFSLLGRLPGIRVRDRGVSVARCDNHGASPGMPGNLHVFVDGILQTSYNGFLRRSAGEALQDVVMSTVQLIEVHTSINTIPPEFASDACAVILVWSR